MKLRLLSDYEYYKVNAIIKDYNGLLLEPLRQKILIAEENNEIIGFISFEYAPHAGPCWVEPNSRNQGLATKLINEIFKFTGPFYVFPSNDPMEKACQKANMEYFAKVYKKES